MGRQKIALFAKGDFNNKVREVFALLDQHGGHPDDVRAVFFEFEFTLLQIAAADPVNHKILVSPLIARMEEVLGSYGGVVESLRCFWYQHLTQERMLDLFYRFNPLRGFIATDGEVLKNLYQVGLYYAAHPHIYQSPESTREREAFLRNRNHKSFLHHEHRDFVMKIFRSRATLGAITDRIEFNEPAAGETTIFYHFTLSLEKFYQTMNITGPVLKTNPEPASLVLRGGQFTAHRKMYGRFVQQVVRKHQAAAGQPEHGAEKSFLRELRRRRSAMAFGGLAHLPRYILFLLPLFAVIWLCANYLLGQPLFSEIGNRLVPSVEMPGSRLVRTSLPLTLFMAYALNIFAGYLLLFAFLLMAGNKKRFSKFLDYNGAMLRRLVFFMLIAPLAFGSVYFVISSIIGELYFSLPYMRLHLSAARFTAGIYSILLIRQVVLVIVALFRMYKSFHLLPVFISVLIYFSIGYFVMFRPLPDSLNTPQKITTASHPAGTSDVYFIKPTKP